MRPPCGRTDLRAGVGNRMSPSSTVMLVPLSRGSRRRRCRVSGGPRYGSSRLLSPRAAPAVHGPDPGAKTASANAAAAAEKTEAFKADSSPVPTVIPDANRNRRTPLRSADHRVKNPRIRATPRTTSATVAAQANAGTVGAGAHGFTRAVYAVKRWKSPHATFAAPAGPDRPNRSATPLRKAAPSARRKKTDA